MVTRGFVFYSHGTWERERERCGGKGQDILPSTNTHTNKNKATFLFNMYPLEVGGKHLERWDSVFSNTLSCPRIVPDESWLFPLLELARLSISKDLLPLISCSSPRDLLNKTNEKQTKWYQGLFEVTLLLLLLIIIEVIDCSHWCMDRYKLHYVYWCSENWFLGLT